METMHEFSDPPVTSRPARFSVLSEAQAESLGRLSAQYEEKEREAALTGGYAAKQFWSGAREGLKNAALLLGGQSAVDAVAEAELAAMLETARPPTLEEVQAGWEVEGIDGGEEVPETR